MTEVHNSVPFIMELSMEWYIVSQLDRNGANSYVVCIHIILAIRLYEAGNTVKIEQYGSWPELAASETCNVFKGKSKDAVSWCLIHVSSLLGLFPNPEDGGDIFLRNASWLSKD